MTLLIRISTRGEMPRATDLASVMPSSARRCFAEVLMRSRRLLVVRAGGGDFCSYTNFLSS